MDEDHVHDWLAASYMSTSLLAAWLTGRPVWPTFFPDSVPLPNHNNRAQISQYLSAKMLKQRLIILFHIFGSFCRSGAALRFSPLLAINYI